MSTSILPNPARYYRLTNHYTGPSAPLSIYRNRATGYIYLTTSTAATTPRNEPITTPYWQILPVHGSDPPRYHICTEYHDDHDDDDENIRRGRSNASRFLALDIFNQDKSKPHLTQPGFYSGQYWSVTAWPRRVCGGCGGEEGDEDREAHDGGNYNDSKDRCTDCRSQRPGTAATIHNVMLTNDYSGPDLHLDTYADTKQGFLDNGDHTGQHWVLEPVEKRGRMGEEVRAAAVAMGGREVARPIRLLSSPLLRLVDHGVTVGLFAFGVGFGAAVVVAMAWVEFLPLLLVVGLSVGGGVSLGLMSPRRTSKTACMKQRSWA